MCVCVCVYPTSVFVCVCVYISCVCVYNMCVSVCQGVSRLEDGGAEAVLRSYLDGGEDAASHGGPAL